MKLFSYLNSSPSYSWTVGVHTQRPALSYPDTSCLISLQCMLVFTAAGESPMTSPIHSRKGSQAFTSKDLEETSDELKVSSDYYIERAFR